MKLQENKNVRSFKTKKNQKLKWKLEINVAILWKIVTLQIRSIEYMEYVYKDYEYKQENKGGQTRYTL